MKKSEIITGVFMAIGMAAAIDSIRIRIKSAYIRGQSDMLEKVTKDIEESTAKLKNKEES